MPTALEATTQSKFRVWTGRVLSTLVILFLLFDAVMKLIHPPPITQAMSGLGFPASLAAPIGVVLLLCTLLYAVPATSVLGAVLLTGYLGGAVASQLRIGAPLFSNTLFPIYFAVLMWAALYLQRPRLRAFLLARG